MNREDATDAPKFKDFILPLIFYKRLSNVFDDEFAEQVAEFGDEESAREIIEADHEDALKNERPPIVRFLYSRKSTVGSNFATTPQTAAWASSSPKPCARLPV